MFFRAQGTAVGRNSHLEPQTRLHLQGHASVVQSSWAEWKPQHTLSGTESLNLLGEFW